MASHMDDYDDVSMLAICHPTVALHVHKTLALGGYRLGLHNEDADQLDAASSVLLPPAIRTPYLLKEPAAPHIAAALENVTFDIGHIVDCHAQALARADIVVVEGVGGFRVPLILISWPSHGRTVTLPMPV